MRGWRLPLCFQAGPSSLPLLPRIVPPHTKGMRFTRTARFIQFSAFFFFENYPFKVMFLCSISHFNVEDGENYSVPSSSFKLNRGEMIDWCELLIRLHQDYQKDELFLD